MRFAFVNLSINETSFQAVSFFLGLTLVSASPVATRSCWAQTPNSVQVPQPATDSNDGMHATLSVQQWKQLLDRSYLALTGRKLDENEIEELAASLPKTRSSVLIQAIQRWCQSKEFVNRQAAQWAADNFGESPNHDATLPNPLPWNFSLHDDWLKQSIAKNQLYFEFLRAQLAADLDTLETEANPERLATASWARAGTLRTLPGYEFLRSKEFNRDLTNVDSLPLVGPFDTLLSPQTASTTTAAARMPLLSLDLPNFYEAATPLQRTQLEDLIQAVQSIANTENKDGNRLLASPEVANWHRKQTQFPLPATDQWTAAWPLEDRGIPVEDTIIARDALWKSQLGLAIRSSPMNIGSGNEVQVPVQQPWNWNEEWSIVFNVSVDSPIEDPINHPYQSQLFSLRPIEQKPSIFPIKDPSSKDPGIHVDIVNGRLRFIWIHDAPISWIGIETTDAWDWNSTHQVAIVYDGLHNASSIRFAVDGRFSSHRVIADSMLRDPVPGKSWKMVWGDSDSHSLPGELEDMESYRVAVTEPELAGLSQSSEWMTWDEMDARGKMGWIEHYARRIDPHWRYERESHLYYLSNSASLRSTIPIVPIMNGNKLVSIDESLARRDRFPMTVVNGEVLIALQIPWHDRSMLADFFFSVPEGRMVLARQETERQWLGLLQSLPPSVPERSERIPASLQASIADFESTNGDRVQWLVQVLASREWLATALDLQP
jgi:hypothetical protein